MKIILPLCPSSVLSYLCINIPQKSKKLIQQQKTLKQTKAMMLCERFSTKNLFFGNHNWHMLMAHFQSQSIRARVRETPAAVAIVELREGTNHSSATTLISPFSSKS